MSDIITTLHPENEDNVNLYPNVKKENIPSGSIDRSKLDSGVNSLLNSINQLHPSGTDTSTNILSYDRNKGIYVGSDNGHWYYWNGTQYVDGGVFIVNSNRAVYYDGYHRLRDVDNNDIFPEITGMLGYIFVGNIKINTTNLTITSTSVQYNIPNYIYNAALPNQTISYDYNTRPTFIYVDKVSGVLNAYDIVSQSSDIANAMYDNNKALIAILYQKRFSLVTSPYHMYIDNVRYSVKDFNLDIVIPNEIPVVLNREIRLEYYNMFKTNDIEQYNIAEGSNNTNYGINLGTSLQIKPNAANTYTNTIYAYKNENEMIRKSFNIKAVSDSTKPTIKAIFLGDSLTNQGFYLAELKTMLGDNLTLYGTRSTTAFNSSYVNVTVEHEGRGGWGAGTYCNNASYNGVTNPFYNNGFDFSYYMSNNPSFNDVTDVFILLGTNDAYNPNYLSNMQTICNSIKNYNSNIKIHIMLPIPPIRSGYGWGVRNYTDLIEDKNKMFNFDKDLISTYDGVSGYSVIATNLNIDCWYDFPRTKVAANMRNPEEIEVGNDNVHPKTYGYYRMSDMIYADIIANS